jgi:hypothetical protein
MPVPWWQPDRGKRHYIRQWVARLRAVSAPINPRGSSARGLLCGKQLLLPKVDERDNPRLDMLPGLALVPIGMGFAVPAMTTSILSHVERH